MKKVVQVQVSTGSHGHMVKTVSEIKQDLKLIDIVCVVLDARIPYASNNKELFEVIKQKSVIMVLNKSDLADKVSLESAENKYKKDGCYTIRTNCVTGEGISELLSLIRELGSRIKNKNKTSEMYKRMNNVYRVMVVGIPNVGKSSLINKLSGKTSAKVGNKPGVTRQKQWIRPAKDIEIMDTAGVLWPKLDENMAGIKLAITGNIKNEVLDQELVAFNFIDMIKENEKYMSYVKARYKLSDDIQNDTTLGIIEKIGENRGVMQKGGIVDVEKTCNMFLDEYRSGKLGCISLE